MKILADPRIGEFAGLIRLGLEAWVRAGELLCALKDENGRVFEAILAAQPDLTPEILASFERIGRRLVLPALVLDGSPGARRLAALPYETQERLHRAPVLVVVKTAAGPVARHKRVCELTRAEANRVIGESGIRGEAEQRRLLRRGGSGERLTGNRCAVEHEPDRPFVDVEAIAVESLDEEPRAQFQRHLAAAQASLLEARSSLVMIRRQDSPHDRHIADALRAVGQLRLKLNEGEI